MTETTLSPAPTARSSLWRVATVACLIVIALGAATGMSMYEQFAAQVSHLQAKLKDVSQIKFITVLVDAQQAPAMLVTLDPQDKALQIQRLNSVKEGGEDTMQLWAVPATGKPRSLGILTSSGKTLRLAATEKTFADVATLAISVENKGGVPEANGPRLPYLFKGVVIQKAL
jgi:anti-sigma-K factor RskA